MPLEATHVADATAPDLGEQVPPVLTPSATARLAALAESADPELVKLFIEEAREELVKIERSFPVWDQNPLEREALVTVRRSFHTLKGSGRMVGARELGELAWAVENLLNRVLDNTLTRSPAILEVLRNAIAALPQMIEHLEKGSPVAADVVGIGARAHALASGRPPAGSARAVAGARADHSASIVEASASAIMEEPSPPPQASPAAAPAAAVTPAPAAAMLRRRSRTSSPRTSIAPATLWPAARRWRRPAMAFGSRSRSITGCAAPTRAASACARRI
jgi:chemotaxis protein histidine kinase CheA